MTTAPDGGGPGDLTVSWGILRNQSQVDCENVGAWTVRILLYEDALTGIVDAMCSDWTATVYGVSTSVTTIRVGLLGVDGAPLATSAYEFVVVEPGGETIVPPVVFQVTNEPLGRMLEIVAAAAADYELAGTIPAGSTGLTPALGVCCASPGMLCFPNPALWDEEPWLALAFELATPHRYSYSYSSNGDSFTVSAWADSDCDGEYTIYGIKAAVCLETGMVEVEDAWVSPEAFP